MLFSLFKGIIIKKEGTHSWQESVSSFQNTFQRKYPNVMIRILNLFCKLKNIKLSDQEWFDRAIAKLNLLEQVCPYCDSKGQMIFHDSYPLHDYFKSQSYRNRNTTDSKGKVRLLWTYSRSFARDADSVFFL